jgi:succinoglycan biosynthesis protein ExoA
LFFELALYSLVILLAGVQMALRKKSPSLAAGVPLAIATMHFAWGSGFLWSLVCSMGKS